MILIIIKYDLLNKFKIFYIIIYIYSYNYQKFLIIFLNLYLFYLTRFIIYCIIYVRKNEQQINKRSYK